MTKDPRFSSQQLTDISISFIIVFGIMATILGGLYIGSKWSSDKPGKFFCEQKLEDKNTGKFYCSEY